MGKGDFLRSALCQGNLPKMYVGTYARLRYVWALSGNTTSVLRPDLALSSGSVSLLPVSAERRDRQLGVHLIKE